MNLFKDHGQKSWVIAPFHFSGSKRWDNKANYFEGKEGEKELFFNPLNFYDFSVSAVVRF